MRTEASLRSRLLIGAGILFVVGVIAFPHRPTQITHWRVPEPSAPAFDASSWFALPSSVEGFALLDGDERWRLAGPLRFDERTDGSARLTGLLVGHDDDSRRLQLDLHLSDRDRDGSTTVQPGDYGDVTGFLRGLGQLDGALVRVRAGGTSPLVTTARRGELALLCEWIETPDSGALPGAEGATEWTVPVSFAEHAVWGAPTLDLDLGSFGESFELRAGGRLVENTDGTAHFSAVVAQRGFGDRAFHLDLQLAQSEPESMAPIEDTSANPLAGPTGLFDDGSLDDETFWRGYDRATGILTGLDSLVGARLRISGIEESVRVGLGAAANGERYGAAGAWTTVVEQQPDDEEFELRRGRSTAFLEAELDSRSVQFAYAPTSGGASGEAACAVLDLGPLGDDWIFAAGGTFFEHVDGTARLVGQLERRSGGDAALWLDARFSGPEFVGESAQSGRRELETWAYSEDGGPIHTESWQRYRNVTGRLSGSGSLADVELTVTGATVPLQLGFGANGRSLSLGASARLRLTPTTQTEGGASRDLPTTAALRFDIRGEAAERVASHGGASALRLEGIGDDFHFISGGHLAHESDGRARLTGVVARRSFSNHRFFVDLRLAGRREPGVAEAGDLGSFTHLEGRLLGLEEFDGALLEVWGGAQPWSMESTGGPDFGASAGLQLTVLRQPRGAWSFRHERLAGDVELALTRTLASGAEEAYALLSVTTPAGHALYLPGIAEDFAFPDGGSFVEHADGTATLTGHARSVSDPQLGFDVRIDYDGGFDDHRLARLQRGLPNSAYAEQGGPVDPKLWRFYRTARGILVGTGSLSGAVLELGSDEDALQIGLGANGRNLEYGASGDLTVRLLGQPIAGGEILPDYLPGAELHIDLPALDSE